MACDLICVSHLRWDFVYQRPQHLMSRAARTRRVLYVEEPVCAGQLPGLAQYHTADGVIRLVPEVPAGMTAAAAAPVHANLIREAAERLGVTSYGLWAYTPMAGDLTAQLDPRVVVYDCMDELSAFLNAPADLHRREAELFQVADVVFVGGQSLFRSKRHLHRNIHCFPSAVDHEHFGAARRISKDPADQAVIPHPRAGFFGVIDERMDLELVRRLAELRPELQLVMLGPVVKIDPASLPQAPNIHWLGGRSYAELPGYIAGWDVAILPFARNEATRFISPTKIPEYLAAGKRVVSTSIRDVVHPYGVQGLVDIADRPETFAAAIDGVLEGARPGWLEATDRLLAHISWDQTWNRMDEQLTLALREAAEVSRLARLPASLRRQRPRTGPAVANGQVR